MTIEKFDALPNTLQCYKELYHCILQNNKIVCFNLEIVRHFGIFNIKKMRIQKIYLNVIIIKFYFVFIVKLDTLPPIHITMTQKKMPIPFKIYFCFLIYICI